MLQFRTPELEQMKRVENEVSRTLAPYQGHTEAGLVIFALIRCARVLLRLYPPSTQRDLLAVIVPFLQGAPGPGESNLETPSGLVIQ